MATVQLEKIETKRVYLLFYLTPTKRIGVYSNWFAEARFALDHGKAMKGKGECLDYSYVGVDSPPLFAKKEIAAKMTA